MFASRYFADRFWAPRYWAKVGAAGITLERFQNAGGTFIRQLAAGAVVDLFVIREEGSSVYLAPGASGISIVRLE